jgi:hypothetical protein
MKVIDRSGSQILIGMDERDYSSLMDTIRKGRKTEWTCHENTQVGDIFSFALKLDFPDKPLEPRTLLAS